ncbi:Hypothetical predicted protein [Pelobates cultripes]|uniref:Uncharacterized protein n=1 Tax=Pelobates cultripes TaxID=61616 RepID=A0AAD1WL28_PELCU|nr:Hypothetical predicted protein [Pelobates cultripes]
MQSQKDLDAPSASAPRLPEPIVVVKPPTQAALEDASQEQMNSEEFQSLLDATIAKSVSEAIFTAMGTMTDNLSESITRALLSYPKCSIPPESKPIAPSGRKSAIKYPIA